MNEWHDLFAATAGAAATLTGLIFVGVSISLTKILSFPTLPTRALLSLTLLLTILICSVVLLIPGQAINSLGIEVLILGLLAWLSVSRMDYSILKNISKEYKKPQRWNVLIDQLAIIPYLIAAIILLCKNESGTYWLVIAFILSFIKAIIDAWVLLVEIHR